MIANVLRSISRLFNRGAKVPYDELPAERLLPALRHPYVRKQMVTCSINEEADNPYYKNLLDLRANHTVGPFPTLFVDQDDLLEEEWTAWGMENSIGKVLRELRREAAKTGTGIAIPFKDESKTHPLRYQIVPSTELQQPRGAMTNDRIIDGVEFNENWDPIKIYLGDDAKEYDLEKDGVLFWSKGNPLAKQLYFPEAVSAFTIYPSVRQFLSAVIESEKFTAAIPMAVELDPKVYGPEEGATPTGKFKYEPGFIPTLPPGTKLTGISGGGSAKDRDATMRIMVAAGARCFNCPVNLALGDSSRSNMASAQVDLQLWKTETEIDRFDYMPIYFQMFRKWFSLRPNFLNTQPVRPRFSASVIFEHPDPVKNANSRAIDLISGARTLHMIYAERSRNPRTELRKEAELLGITEEELRKIIIANRTNKVLEVLERLDANSRNED